MQTPIEDFVAGAPGLFALLDSELYCRAKSQALQALLPGHNPQSPGPLFPDFLSPGSSAEFERAIRPAFEKEMAPAELNVEFLRDGFSDTGRLYAWPLTARDGETLVVVHISPAQNAQKLEARLQDLRNRHESILEAAGDGIYGIDAAGHTAFVNRAASELLGWKPEDILGKPLHDVHHHSHADGTPYPLNDCPIYAALQDGDVHHVEDEVFWTAGGEAIPVEYTSTPILQDGEITGAVIVFRDIRRRLETERQRAAAFAELESVKRRLELILDAAGEGIYGIDRDGNGTFANTAAIELLGWRHEDVIGHGVHEMHHHSHADGSPYPRHDCPVYAALTDAEVHRVDDEVFWTKDGAARQVEYTSTPILSDRGEPDGAVVVFRDISERKRIEQERDEAFEKIRELNRQLEQEVDYLREEVDLNVNFGEIVGESPALHRTLSQVDAVAATPVSVLILGESGVGKEMIARAIHAASDRSNFPLIKVNCASIPRELFESEFFGHVKGAFTGAHRDRVGRMHLANGGTLFLDEVGEIPLSLQGKLLRALQEGEFEQVGSDETTKVDVRIVAATNKDLQAEVKAGKFREDLYYRLSVFPISVPPLRERTADILPLAAHFVNRFCDELGRERLAISKQQAGLLKSQRWSGNIRELKNVMERAVILSRGKRIRLDLDGADSVEASSIFEQQSDDGDFLTETELREFEKNNLLAVLKQANGRVSGPGGAAELLGIKPSTLSYRIRAFGIAAGKPEVPWRS